ncbi:MAG: PKD domain-containing protein [bacterium]
MKKTMTFLFFWALFLPAFSQSPLYISGVVYEAGTSNPVTNHAVYIQSDSVNGNNFPYFKTVYSDVNGNYADTILIPAGINQWQLILSTYDCNYNLHSFDTLFVSGMTVIYHNFYICVNQNPNLPTVTTGTASDITITTAVLHGFVDPNGSQTYVTFEYGTTTSYGTYLSCGYFNGDSIYPVTGTISNLQPGALYHYRIVGTNSVGAAYGSDSVFVAQGSTECQAYFYPYADSSSNLTYQFVDQSQGNPTTWTWNFGDGSAPVVISFPNNPNIVHTYAQAGIYVACLTIQGADSICYDTFCDTLFVGGGSGCQAQFTYYQDSVPAADYLVQFMDLSLGNPVSWQWYFSDSTYSYEQNPVHAFPGPGNYYVCLTIQCQGIQSTWCQTVVVGNTPGCTNYFTYQQYDLQVSFNGYLVSQQPADYTWNFGDGNSASGSSVTHTYQNQGIYYVTLTTVTADSMNCTYTSSQTIQVGDSAQFHQVYGQVYTGTFPLQTGIAMIFSLDSNQNYSPYIATCPIDSMGLYYFSMVPDGNYYVYVLPFNPSGYLPTYYGDVLEWQNATLIILGQESNPYDIHLIAADSSANGNGAITGQISMGSVKADLLDKITMILMDAEGSPIAYYKVSSEGEFVFPSLGYGIYLLRAEIPGVTSDVVQVVISSENPVAEVIMTFAGNKLLGINEEKPVITASSLYPNPVTDHTSVSVKAEKAGTISVEVYDLMGRRVLAFNRDLESGNNLIGIPVSQLPSGIYTLVIRSSEGLKITQKLIKL